MGWSLRGAGSSYMCCRNCLHGPAVPHATPLPEAPQTRGAHLGCCACVWGFLFWEIRKGWRDSSGLTGWTLGLCGEAEGPGLLDQLRRRPKAHPATAAGFFSEKHRISKVGKYLGHHQVKRISWHHLVSLSLLSFRIKIPIFITWSSKSE